MRVSRTTEEGKFAKKVLRDLERGGDLSPQAAARLTFLASQEDEWRGPAGPKEDASGGCAEVASYVRHLPSVDGLRRPGAETLMLRRSPALTVHAVAFESIRHGDLRARSGSDPPAVAD